MSRTSHHHSTAGWSGRGGQAANFMWLQQAQRRCGIKWYFNTNTILFGQTNTSLSIIKRALSNGWHKYSVTVTTCLGGEKYASATLKSSRTEFPNWLAGRRWRVWG